jgi:hypothetical protein
VLKAIRARPEVADVRVAVAMFDSPDWPFSETVWVMTSASPETVWSWFPEDLRPDETWAGCPLSCEDTDGRRRRQRGGQVTAPT